MPVSSVLDAIRKQDYGGKGEESPEPEGRRLPLAEGEYAGAKPGPITCIVHGTFDGKSIDVESVEVQPTMPDQGVSPQEAGIPMMQNQTMPSPS